MSAENTDKVALAKLFRKCCVIDDMQATDAKGALTELVEALIKAGIVKKGAKKKLVEILAEREDQGSTGIGNGAAVPHAAFKGINGLVGAIGRSAAGIDFNCVTGEKVRVFFLVLYHPDRQDERRTALGRILEPSRETNFIKFIKAAGRAKEITDLLDEVDGEA